MLYGFSYTRPCHPALPPTFVVAGAGELPEGILSAAAIVRPGDLTPEGIAAKAAFVLDLMENRLRGLGRGWQDVTAIQIYTVHPLAALLPETLLRRAAPAQQHGVHWFFSRPPLVGIEFEMDLRGVRTELRIG
jgi:hypothetical protein